MATIGKAMNPSSVFAHPIPRWRYIGRAAIGRSAPEIDRVHAAVAMADALYMPYASAT
jgi:hypothetical protein